MLRSVALAGPPSAIGLLATGAPQSTQAHLCVVQHCVRLPTALGPLEPVSPVCLPRTPVSAIENPATYVMDQLLRFGHFVDQKTWDFQSARTGCNDDFDRNPQFARAPARESAKKLGATPAPTRFIQVGPEPTRLTRTRRVPLTDQGTWTIVSTSRANEENSHGISPTAMDVRIARRPSDTMD